MNNPPVGLVTPQTDPDTGQRKKYVHDPHLDPELKFDGRKVRDELAAVIERGLASSTLEEAKAVSRQPGEIRRILAQAISGDKAAP